MISKSTRTRWAVTTAALLMGAASAFAQTPAAPAQPPATGLNPQSPDSRRMEPAYPVPYAPATVTEIAAVLGRVRDYLEEATPAKLVDRDSGAEIADVSTPHDTATLARGDFRIVSYEWGVTYSGMLLAGDVTGDAKFTNYAAGRLKFIADVTPVYRPLVQALPPMPEGRPAPGAGRLRSSGGACSASRCARSSHRARSMIRARCVPP